MKIEQIDNKVHGAIAILGLIAFSCTFAALNGALNQWHQGRETNRQQNQELSAIERSGDIDRANISQDAQTAQLAADKNIAQYNLIKTTDYVCDPNRPPTFAFKAMADPRETLEVIDQNDLIVGRLSPEGEFTFTPNNCKPIN